MILFPRVWELIEGFKLQCGRRGWKVCQNEDLVDVGGEYHHLIWARHIYPDTFRKVVMNPHASVREGAYYRTVRVSYAAWISPESIAEKILDAFLEGPDLPRKVAIYDISPVYTGDRVCLRMNRTNSIVFREFERFLNEEYSISFRPIYELLQPSQNI